MEWTLRLVGTGIDDQSRSFDVMPISRPDGLGEIANLGLTLAEAKLLLAQVQQVVAAQAHHHAMLRPDCQSCGETYHAKGWATASDCDAVRRGQGEASSVGVCRLRLWRDRRQLAIALPLDPWAGRTAGPAVCTDAVSSCG
jgi:hypothetical protein